LNFARLRRAARGLWPLAITPHDEESPMAKKIDWYYHRKG
jgi:hypothetical protein